MTYFADLTPYTYFTWLANKELNVGWLDDTHPFTVGPTTAAFRDALRAVCANKRVVHTKGWHVCKLCPTFDRTKSGTAEIRVMGASGQLYAAPELILHYVEAHNYRPPEDFIQGVVLHAGND